MSNSSKPERNESITTASVDFNTCFFAYNAKAIKNLKVNRNLFIGLVVFFSLIFAGLLLALLVFPSFQTKTKPCISATIECTTNQTNLIKKQDLLETQTDNSTSLTSVEQKTALDLPKNQQESLFAALQKESSKYTTATKTENTSDSVNKLSPVLKTLQFSNHSTQEVLSLLLSLLLTLIAILYFAYKIGVFGNRIHELNHRKGMLETIERKEAIELGRLAKKSDPNPKVEETLSTAVIIYISYNRMLSDRLISIALCASKVSIKKAIEQYDQLLYSLLMLTPKQTANGLNQLCKAYEEIREHLFNSVSFSIIEGKNKEFEKLKEDSIKEVRSLFSILQQIVEPFEREEIDDQYAEIKKNRELYHQFMKKEIEMLAPLHKTNRSVLRELFTSENESS